MMARSRYFRWSVALVLLGCCVFAGASAYFAVRFTSGMPRAAGSFEAWLPRTTENVRFAARDGISLSGWFVPRESATCAAVLLHGHGSHRRQMLARAKLLHAHGYAVLLYDARGHGESGGDHVSIGWFEARDLLGALDYLRGRGLREFGLVGESMGGATIALAARELRDVRWAVLESVYPDLRDAIDCRFRDVFGIPGWLGAALMMPIAERRLGFSVDEVSPLNRIAELRCPTFILHGDRDRHTRPESARALFARATEPKAFWLVPGAAHVDLHGFAKRNYEERLLQFIRQASSQTLVRDQPR